MPKSIDMTGRQYGRLTVLEPASRKGYWYCKCQCGVKKQINGSSLRQRITSSCGCYRNERIRETKETHGKSNSKIYRLWSMMHDRCTNPANKYFKNYGGRGITVCPKWASFEAFYADMGDMPDGMSLERIKNNKGYSKENCKWATRKEQSRNRRSNRLLTYQGITQSLVQWAEHLGVNYNTLNSRVQRGWSDERVLTQPIKTINDAPF